MHAEYVFPYPADAIFDFVTDLRHEPRWNPQLERVALLTPEPIGPASAWLLDYAQVRGMRAQTVAWERPHRVAWEFRSALMDMDVSTVISSTPEGGCVLRTEATMELRGLLQAFAPLVQVVVRQDFATRGPKVLRAFDEWRAGL